jgi:hypothetical protein
MGALSRATRHVVGHAVSLDGTNEYGSMGDVLDFERTDAFTIAAIVIPAANNSYIVAKHESSGNRGYGFAISSASKLNFLLLSTNGTSELNTTSDTVLPLGRLSVVAVAYTGNSNASGVTFYVNGSATAKTDGVNNLSTTTVNSADLMLGARSGPSGFYNGRIPALCIWNRALSGAEVASLSTGILDSNWSSVSGRVGHWAPTAASSHSSLPDLSGGGFNCALSNTEAGDIVPVYHHELRVA